MKHKKLILVSIFTLVILCVIVVAPYKRAEIDTKVHKLKFVDKTPGVVPAGWEKSICIVVAKKQYQYVMVLDQYGKQYQITWLDGVDSSDLEIGQAVSVYKYSAVDGKATSIVKIGHKEI